jgi:DNA-binding response OmpR family regulator/signal transduction histidine kinase
MNTNSTLKILVIEDNPGDANLVKVYLRDSSVKHELILAANFFEGSEEIKNNAIDLVLLDLTLPDSAGFKTLSTFLEKFPMVPVIVLTGVNNEIVGNQSIKAGAQDFLVKGQFDGKLLGRSIRYSLQRFKTQLKLEEAARSLEISEKRNVEAQEMAHFGNWEVDIVSNEMKWTDEIYRIFGFQPGSIHPTLSDYINYVHIEDRPKVEEFFQVAAKDGKLHNIEHRIIIEGRTIKHIALQAKVYHEEINNKILLVGAVQDITERKLSEQLILEKNISSKASKIKEEALADMSFHIRTPLSSIVNLLFLLENNNENTQQTEYIDGLKTSVDDLSIMINNLLNFSVLMSDKIKVEEEEVQIKDFLASIHKVMKIKADNSNVELNFETNELPNKLLIDPNKVTQVLYNLIDNAIKHTPENGKITVDCYCKEAINNKASLHFKIQDNGTGMPQSKVDELLEADKLLEIYSEGNPDDKKRQLGMAIVTMLIKTMDGKLIISSSEGEGSIFDITIPVKIPKQLTFNEGDKPDIPLKILLVEDHFLNQIATKKVLTTWSDLVSVDIAENGLIGVEKFREHGYDLVLMDLQMPVMTGIEASQKIREKSNVPIIALTANSSKQEADKCFEAGINDYIAKPFKPQDLYAKIMNQLITVTH